MMELWFSQSESALVMATKSNGKPISSWTDLGPDLQMRFNAEPWACGNTVEIRTTEGNPNNSGVQASRRS